MSRILTIGYTGRSMQELVDLTVAEDAVLVDCRYVPFSRAPMWQKRSFVAAFSEPATLLPAGVSRYRHFKGWGNENYRQAGLENVRLHDPTLHLGDARQIVAERSIMLMCACADSVSCHRRLVAHWLADILGWPDTVIEHVAPPVASSARARRRGAAGNPATEGEREGTRGTVDGVHRGPMEPPTQKELFGL